MKPMSIRDVVGPIMVGPSSSHTAGALRIASMVRNLLDHDFTPYAMLVLGLEKSEVFQSLYGIANVAITGVSIDGAELPVAASEAKAADSIRLTATATRSS